MPVLLLSVRFHDGRYHGSGDWPPAPARLFQALVAGAACGHRLVDRDKAALTWLECLPAPVIAAPFAYAGRGFTNFVPNNDLDAVGGDPRRVGEIRAGKTIRPRIFDAETPFLYAWIFVADETGEDRAKVICTVAERLYQLGRGIDMAWAWGEILDANEIEKRLSGHAGVVHRPGGEGGTSLACPQVGSLAKFLSCASMRRESAFREAREKNNSSPSRRKRALRPLPMTARRGGFSSNCGRLRPTRLSYHGRSQELLGSSNICATVRLTN